MMSVLYGFQKWVSTDICWILTGLTGVTTLRVVVCRIRIIETKPIYWQYYIQWYTETTIKKIDCRSLLNYFIITVKLWFTEFINNCKMPKGRLSVRRRDFSPGIKRAKIKKKTKRPQKPKWFEIWLRILWKTILI